MAQRDSCPTAGTWCSKVGAFDNATAIFSHEIEEAAVDPYPFTGFFDPLKFPWWTEGEISDICEDSPYDKFRVDDFVLSTYWSNIGFDCVGNYRSQVRIVAPTGVIPWTSTTRVFAQADATAAIDRGSMLEDDTSWYVDGVYAGRGLSPVLPALSAGTHHIEVVVVDANSFEARDATDFTLVADCAADFGAACGSCGGSVQCDGSCSVTGPPDLGVACGSCGGTVQCDGTCSVATPPDLGQACGCGGSVQCNGKCSSLCSLNVSFSNIDDDAYVWLSTPDFDSNPASSICQINQGSPPRAGDCDLGGWMSAAGLEAATFVVKIGNGGCFNSHGDISFVVNGSTAWGDFKSDTGPFTHCGWTYRAVLNVDLRAGSVTPVDLAPADNPNYCFDARDCPF
jgi:hypothetical protein